MPAAEVKVRRRGTREEKYARSIRAREWTRERARTRVETRGVDRAGVSNRLERNGFSRGDARRETRETGSTPMTREVIGEKNPSSRRRRRSRWTDVSIARR
tara:strand:+ start:379 stop:681 length:303 start_codon:yes stop_codon:yes gene_type:complete